MGLKKKLTVELPPETMALLDRLTDNSGTGSRGRTIQLMAETIEKLQVPVDVLRENIPTVRVFKEGVPSGQTLSLAVNAGEVIGGLERFYPRKKG